MLLLHVETRERANAFLAVDCRGRAYEQAAVSAAGPAQLVALGVEERRRRRGAALLVELEAVVLRRVSLLSVQRRGLDDEIPVRQVRDHVNSLLFHLGSGGHFRGVFGSICDRPKIQRDFSKIDQFYTIISSTCVLV